MALLAYRTRQNQCKYPAIAYDKMPEEMQPTVSQEIKWRQNAHKHSKLMPSEVTLELYFLGDGRASSSLTQTGDALSWRATHRARWHLFLAVTHQWVVPATHNWRNCVAYGHGGVDGWRRNDRWLTQKLRRSQAMGCCLSCCCYLEVLHPQLKSQFRDLRNEKVTWILSCEMGCVTGHF